MRRVKTFAFLSLSLTMLSTVDNSIAAEAPRMEASVSNTSFNAHDRLAIINLIYSYGYFLDELEIDNYFDLFTNNPTIEFWQGDNKIVEGLSEFKKLTLKRRQTFKQENIQRRHILSAPRFDQQSKLDAVGLLYFQLYSVKDSITSLIGTGVYEYAVVKLEGKWKINRWIAKLDSSPD